MESWLVFGRNRIHSQSSISKTPFIRCYPIFQEVLDRVQQYCRSSILDSAYRPQQRLSFRNGEPLMYNNSKKSHHRLCQIPKICQYKVTFGLSVGSRNFLKLRPIIEQPNVAPWLHTGDWFEIHNLQYELLWSGVVLMWNSATTPFLSGNHSNQRTAWRRPVKVSLHVCCQVYKSRRYQVSVSNTVTEATRFRSISSSIHKHPCSVSYHVPRCPLPSQHISHQMRSNQLPQNTFPNNTPLGQDCLRRNHYNSNSCGIKPVTVTVI